MFSHTNVRKGGVETFLEKNGFCQMNIRKIVFEAVKKVNRPEGFSSHGNYNIDILNFNILEDGCKLLNHDLILILFYFSALRIRVRRISFY